MAALKEGQEWRARCSLGALWCCVCHHGVRASWRNGLWRTSAATQQNLLNTSASHCLEMFAGNEIEAARWV